MQLPLDELSSKLRRVFIGRPRDPGDSSLFHRLSLTALLAWIGFGLDGISSSAYGPPEAFIGLQDHVYLSVFLALMMIVTIFVISSSYMQVIELFPGGGGGYVVASKLLSPVVGMISGCALIVDYVLTITVSVAAGVDAVFSFMPLSFGAYKIVTCLLVVVVLILMNLRGARESVVPLVPLFLVFLFTHLVLIVYAIAAHAGRVPTIAVRSVSDFHQWSAQIGTLGVFLILLHAYSVGSGTYTGIEAVSNGVPLIREPRVVNGKRTTLYMAVSLAVMAGGLILSYLLYRVRPVEGKTLNAVLAEQVTVGWPGGYWFVLVTLVSEALILVVAAQTGFLGGPRVIANMALDRWMPYRYALLSDRFVTQNGVLTMGIAAIVVLLISRGSVGFLVVLYSINVFLTFTLSQLGMFRHWWNVRRTERRVAGRMIINGLGLFLCAFILVAVVALKFFEGGWLTLVITASLIGFSFFIRAEYVRTQRRLRRLDHLAEVAVKDDTAVPEPATRRTPRNPIESRTAIVLTNGFRGVSLHTLFSVLRTFPGQFDNFVFVQVGILDVVSFRGKQELERLRSSIEADLARFTHYMELHGFTASGEYEIGTDVAEEVERIALRLKERFPDCVLFGGQLVFEREPLFSNILHNSAARAIQRRLATHGVRVLFLPIRVPAA